jgi:hypothetical protein
MSLFNRDSCTTIAIMVLAGSLSTVALADDPAPAASADQAAPAATSPADTSQPAAASTDAAAKPVKHVRKATGKNSIANSPKDLTPVTPPSHETSFWQSLNPKNASIYFQIGGFGASQGNEQGVRIKGLDDGDYFTITHHYAQNVLVGLGYYINGYQNNLVRFLYGLNIFFFPNTTVKGSITQEELFTNLSYKYTVVNVPVYAGIKALLNTGSSRYNITIDVGVGANTIRTSSFSETSLDGGHSLPDAEAFSGVTSVAVSAMAGMGITFNNVYRNIPLEINYRFFYLGQSNFNTTNNQIQTTLHTGNSYANAFFFTLKL